MGRAWQRLVHRIRVALLLHGIKLPGQDIERIERDWERNYQQAKRDGDRLIRTETRILRGERRRP